MFKKESKHYSCCNNSFFSSLECKKGCKKNLYRLTIFQFVDQCRLDIFYRHLSVWREYYLYLLSSKLFFKTRYIFDMHAIFSTGCSLDLSKKLAQRGRGQVIGVKYSGGNQTRGGVHKRTELAVHLSARAAGISGVITCPNCKVNISLVAARSRSHGVFCIGREIKRLR